MSLTLDEQVKLITSVAQLLIGLASFSLSVYLLMTQRRSSRISTHESMLKSFNEILRFGLQSPENLKTLGEVLYPDRKDKPEELRQFLTCLTVFNALEQLLITKRNRGIDAQLADDIVRILLRSAMQNPVAAAVMSRGTYVGELKTMAEQVLAEIRRTSPPPGRETPAGEPSKRPEAIPRDTLPAPRGDDSPATTPPGTGGDNSGPANPGAVNS
jgi:hypothetical protein